MTFAKLIETGSGALGFRLEIEGWPYVYVTDPAITFGTNADGRTVVAGLLYDGLRRRERVVLRDCKLDASGMTVRIRPTLPDEDTLDSFANVSPPIAIVDGAGIDDNDTALVLDDGSLLSGTYHMGTEAIHVTNNGAVNTMERAVWGTQAQYHLNIADTDTTAHVFANPQTCEGRRAKLFAYARGDGMAGDGTQIWCGKVSRAPKLESDGVTWSIGLDSVTSILDQEIAAQEDTWRVRGIYHSAVCPFAITLKIQGTERSRWISGHFEDSAALQKAVSDEIADMLSDYSYTRIANVSWSYFSGFDTPVLAFKTGATEPESGGNGFGFMLMGSVLEGWLREGSTQYVYNSGALVIFPTPGTANVPVHPSLLDDGLSANTGYTVPFDNVGFAESKRHGYMPPWDWKRQDAYTAVGMPLYGRGTRGLEISPTPDEATYPRDRVYLDRDVGTLAVGDKLVFEAQAPFPAPAGEMKPYALTITAKSDTDNWVELDGYDGSRGALYLNGDVEFRFLRALAENSDLHDFQEAVDDAAPFANLGDVPHITYEDMTDWTAALLLNATRGTEAFLEHRDFVFAEPVSFLDVVTEELKLRGMIPRLDSAGKFDILPIPDLSSNPVPVATIDEDDILDHGSGLTGEWPGWIEAMDGVVSTYEMKLGYNPVEGDFDPSQTFTIKDAQSIALHKNRGDRGKMVIAPKSSVTSSAPRITAETALRLVETLKSVMQQEYAVITLVVSFRLFNLRIGDVVALTHPLILDGQGGRGLSAAYAMVLGIDVPLDGKDSSGITLQLMVSREAAGGGYTPSGKIDTQTNTSGNTWELTFDAADGLNIVMSPALDGVVTTHMRAGDLITLVQLDDETPTQVEGVIDSVDGSNAVTVTMGATWTPGGDTWCLEYSLNGGTPTAYQQGFTYIADGTRRLVNGERSRNFV